MAGPLKNHRHELFAQARLAGQTIDAAYQSAGFKANSGNAARLNGNESVRKRIEELQSAAAGQAVLSKTWVIDRLMQVVERCMQAEPVKDSKGIPTGEYVFNATGANKALELLGKEEGMFVDKSESVVTHKHEETIDDVQAAVKARREERQRASERTLN